MTIHDKIAGVLKPFVGVTLSTRQVQVLVREKYPDTNPTSIIPSDHSGPNPRSGRSYCNCSGKPFQIFERAGAGYKVLDSTGVVSVGGVVSGYAPSRRANVTNSPANVRDAQKAVIIDDVFISEWEPKYDETENDEAEYQRLVPAVAHDMASRGTISEDTFRRIWKWKGAMRVFGHVLIEKYDTLYAPAFRRAASESPERKLSALLGPGVKLPGVEAPTGSTVIHFMHPASMPIIDVRTVEVLFSSGLISTDRRDLARYEEFRHAIEGISSRCPGWTLRQIDRALFAYHKQVLGKGLTSPCREAS